MNMAKYRIKVEALDPSEELRAEYRIGMECDGFCIMMDRGDGEGNCVIKDMSIVGIAALMASDEMTLPAAVLAKAMAEGKQLTRDLKARSLAEMIMGGLKGED